MKEPIEHRVERVFTQDTRGFLVVGLVGSAFLILMGVISYVRVGLSPWLPLVAAAVAPLAAIRMGRWVNYLAATQKTSATRRETILFLVGMALIAACIIVNIVIMLFW